MKIKRLIFLVTALALLIVSSACSNKPSTDTSSISGSETASNTASNNISTGSDKSTVSQSSSLSKNDTNSKTNNSSRTASVVHKNPNKTSSTSTDSVSSESETLVQATLLEEVEFCTPNELFFFNVKNTVFSSTSYVPLDNISAGIKNFDRVISGDEIMRFKEDLEIDKWKSQKYYSQTRPRLSIYLSETLHINLELQNDEASWMSICSPLGKAYYVVPQSVYDNVLDFYINIE